MKLLLDEMYAPAIAEQLRARGHDVASVHDAAYRALEGEPDHQDVYLNDAEKRSATKIITCVSRAKSARLVLDL